MRESNPMAFTYSQKFYDEMKVTNLSSARVVARVVAPMVRPKSVVDVGCGTGIWLKAFQEQGVKDVFGVDGSWVKPDMLVIPLERFAVENLEKPFSINRKADLAVSLEVGEHLPHDAAKNLVDNLTSIAPVVLFSAAIPYQGGSRHINEQWPEYWRKLFAERGYRPVDCVRRRIWDDKEVSFFYAQNIIVYVDSSKLSAYPALEEEVRTGHGNAHALVHPHMYVYFAERWRLLVPFLGKIPPSVLHKAKSILRAFKGKRK